MVDDMVSTAGTICEAARLAMDQGANDVIAAARQDLANFKVPKRVIVVDALPRNTMAKVQKNVLRETYEALFAG